MVPSLRKVMPWQKGSHYVLDLHVINEDRLSPCDPHGGTAGGDCLCEGTWTMPNSWWFCVLDMHHHLAGGG